MKNVCDIKREKGLNLVLPLHSKEYAIKDKVAVVIHLHYIDTIKEYLPYIIGIPEEIDIFITVSNIEMHMHLEDLLGNQKNNIRIIDKENRGRDISAFLVACRERILKYNYVAFVHDKKEKSSVCKSDTLKWIHGLWENTLGSAGYIRNVIEQFSDNSELGLLVPPPPISEHMAVAYTNTWMQDFQLTKHLAEKMNLNCDLNPDKSPLTLGTVFWARVDALRRLLEIEWKYEDFDEEPMANDGTVSHAIERILAYVAQDAEFDTGWVMTERYASERFEYMHQTLEKVFDRFYHTFGIRYIAEVDEFEDKTKDMVKFLEQYEKFYIYGAGVYGECCFNYLKQEQKIPEAFIVSRLKEEDVPIQGISIRALDEIELDESCGIIVAVSKLYRDEIAELLKKHSPKFSNIYFFERLQVY